MRERQGVLGDEVTAYATVFHEGTEIKVDNRAYAISARAFLIADGANAILVPAVAPPDHQGAVDLFADGYRAMSS